MHCNAEPQQILDRIVEDQVKQEEEKKVLSDTEQPQMIEQLNQEVVESVSVELPIRMSSKIGEHQLSRRQSSRQGSQIKVSSIKS